ncbi:hypothetical protein P3T76_009345 [Phytophthora citrophthora]|uniref:Uncharacterized protein n=1 Tax=Phytophthora citrophthora TaxID=4793 RepID=A0AAD9LIZ1_9STRA|nr:hypothetical protein P3T76_009345 [Phytophthora citrophthora]
MLPEKAVDAEDAETKEDEAGTGGFSDGEDTGTGSVAGGAGLGFDCGSGAVISLPVALAFAFSRICFTLSPSFSSVGLNSIARSNASAASSYCSNAASAQALR